MMATWTLADGKGKWWEGYDPSLLYGINLREYKGVKSAAYTGWSAPPAGIFTNHIDYAKWYTTQWALRMMDVVDQYDPDFIYTDGTVQGPFTGNGTAQASRPTPCRASWPIFITEPFRGAARWTRSALSNSAKRTNGTVNTEEHGLPAKIKNDQPWIGETPVGDWFYAPNFTYDSGMMIRYIIEAVARDGNAAISIAILPDGSLDAGSLKNAQGSRRLDAAQRGSSLRKPRLDRSRRGTTRQRRAKENSRRRVEPQPRQLQIRPGRFPFHCWKKRRPLRILHDGARAGNAVNHQVAKGGR